MKPEGIRKNLAHIVMIALVFVLLPFVITWAETAEWPDVPGLIYRDQMYYFAPDNPYGGIEGEVAGIIKENVFVDGEKVGGICLTAEVLMQLLNNANEELLDGDANRKVIVPFDISAVDENVSIKNDAYRTEFANNDVLRVVDRQGVLIKCAAIVNLVSTDIKATDYNSGWFQGKESDTDPTTIASTDTSDYMMNKTKENDNLTNKKYIQMILFNGISSSKQEYYPDKWFGETLFTKNIENNLFIWDVQKNSEDSSVQLRTTDLLTAGGKVVFVISTQKIDRKGFSIKGYDDMWRQKSFSSGLDRYIITGQKLQLEAEMNSDRTPVKIKKWQSSDNKIASVDKKGVLTAAPGITSTTTVTITASAEDESLPSVSCDYLVAPLVTSINLLYSGKNVDGATITYDISQEVQTLDLDVVILPVHESLENFFTLNTAPDVADIIDRNYDPGAIKVQIKSIGKTNITVGTMDGSHLITSCEISVISGIKDISVSGNNFVATGKKIVLSASALPDTATDKRIKWTSSDDTVASVDAKGVVTAKKVLVAAPVTITATALDGSGTFADHKLTVYPSASQITIMVYDEPESKTNQAVVDLPTDNPKLQLSTSVHPETALQTVTWKSSSPTVASIDDTGLVTGLKKGTATITATAADGSGKKASVKVSVTVLAKEITINGSTALKSGKQTMLKAQVLPAETVNKKVTWASSDETVATVSTSGTVKAKKVTEEKTVIITASAADGSGVAAEFVITVTP